MTPQQKEAADGVNITKLSDSLREGMTMMRLTRALLTVCVVIPITTVAMAQEREPISIKCQGKAMSPLADSGGGYGGVSLSATFNFGQLLEVVLIDNRTNQLQPPFDAGVDVRTGSLTVERAGRQDSLKILWQRGSTSTDFIGFAITRGYAAVLQVDSFDYEKSPKGTEIPFGFFDGFNTILYRGTCTTL
jgi:hypothetical protein